ncbi:MAG: hypothetical protein CTY13_02000 [Methylobacter sp.]|nr:MAG: hypothetical protein CTY13_02000 [Methylobacter sp.]
MIKPSKLFKDTFRKPISNGGLIVLTMLLVACTVIETHGQNNFEPTKAWVLLPFQNYSGTPRANDKVEEILATILRNKGINNLQVYQNQNAKNDIWLLMDDKRQQQDALAWARQNNYNYGITGNIEEWHYKTGVGGEPAVGLSLRIIEIPTGKVVWSVTGAKSGWGAETVSGTAQKLLRSLLSDLEIKTIS